MRVFVIVPTYRRTADPARCLAGINDVAFYDASSHLQFSTRE
jgi:hypothetical protein